jgi:hypothetical protein
MKLNTVISVAVSLALSNMAMAQSAASQSGQFSVRAGIGGGVNTGDFLPGITGRGALKTDDVYKSSLQFSLGFGFALSEESQVTFDITRRQAEGKNFLPRVGISQSALSDAKSTSAILGFEYMPSGLTESGFVFGGGVGYERTDALTLSVLSLTNRSNGFTADVRAGYQFALAENALLRLAVTPTYSAKREPNTASTTLLGLGNVKEESSITIPVTLQFEYRF